jgi:hypothetical protein
MPSESMASIFVTISDHSRPCHVTGNTKDWIHYGYNLKRRAKQYSAIMGLSFGDTLREIFQTLVPNTDSDTLTARNRRPYREAFALETVILKCQWEIVESKLSRIAYSYNLKIQPTVVFPCQYHSPSAAFIFSWRYSPHWARASSLPRLRDHIQTQHTQ